MIVRAPAKLNLCLYLGPAGDGGLHELCSLFEALSLSDLISMRGAEADSVICPGVEGPNLAQAALEGLRELGWERPPLEIEIDKRVPVAAGLGGGSADAAAVLRLARGAVPDAELLALAERLGADVPSQLDPGMALVRGAGERVEPLPAPALHAVVLVPGERGLSTGDVYGEADRLGTGRSAAELEDLATRLREAAGGGASPLAYTGLLVNDLQPAAISLMPEIGEALAALAGAGAAHAMVTGSGPTAFGLFDDLARADRAVNSLPARFGGALVASPALIA